MSSNWWFDCMVSYIICFLKTGSHLSTLLDLCVLDITRSWKLTQHHPHTSVHKSWNNEKIWLRTVEQLQYCAKSLHINRDTLKKQIYTLTHARVWIMPSNVLQYLNLRNPKFWEHTSIVWVYSSTKALNIWLTNLLHNWTRDYIG